MYVPLTIGDFLDRGVRVFRDRPAVIDEPDVPDSLGTLTYGELDARARGMALWSTGSQLPIVPEPSSRWVIRIVWFSITSQFPRTTR